MVRGRSGNGGGGPPIPSTSMQSRGEKGCITLYHGTAYRDQAGLMGLPSNEAERENDFP